MNEANFLFIRRTNSCGQHQYNASTYMHKSTFPMSTWLYFYKIAAKRSRYDVIIVLQHFHSRSLSLQPSRWNLDLKIQLKNLESIES